MLEYVLFSKVIREKFLDWLKTNKIAFELADNNEELLVLINEDIDNLIAERIEVQYDLLLDESEKIADKEDEAHDSVHLVEIQFTNQAGGMGNVQISPELANRIQYCLTATELQVFVQLIADEVINPSNKSLCQS